MSSRVSKVVVLGGLILSQQAWAGPGISGGGAAWVCRDSNHKVTSARLYDLYVADQDNRHPMAVIRNIDSVSKQLDSALARLNTGLIALIDVPYDVSLLHRALGLVERDWLPLPAGTHLPFKPDVEPDFVPSEPGCDLETAANYDDPSATLRVDMEIVSHLSLTDQAGLKAHEAVYKINRLFFGATNSKSTRDSVARLFSRAVAGGPDVPLPNLGLALRSLESGEGNNLSPERLDLFLGGKSLYCVSAAGDILALGFAKGADPLDGSDQLFLIPVGADTLGWDDSGQSEEIKLDHLQIPGDSFWEDQGVITTGGSDTFSLTFRYMELLTDEAYVSGKRTQGSYSYLNNRDVDNIPNLEVQCGIQ